MAARVNLLASHAVAADTLRDDARCSAADCDDAGAYAIGDADRPARSARVPAAAERDCDLGRAACLRRIGDPGLAAAAAD
jgi:hypothetical protein